MRVWLLIACVAGWAAAKEPPAARPVQAPPLHEVQGKIQSIHRSDKVVRLATEQGFSIEFTYDASTVIKEGLGRSPTIDDLAYDDPVVVRYVGKNLLAKEIEKHGQPTPDVAGSTPTTTPAN